MAKFLPVFGEVYTAAESAVCLVQAAGAAIFGNDEMAEECWEGAVNAWKDYSESNLIANPVSQLISYAAGDKAKVKELREKFCSSGENVLNGTPGVGHVKGIVHYALGNVEEGHRCMEAATRTLAVIGAGAVTGGVGGGIILGVGAGIATGAAYDGTATVVDNAINGSQNAKLHGNFALFDADKITPNDVAQTILGFAVDGLSGASGAKLGKNISARISRSAAQTNLEATYRNVRVLNPSQATKITMDAAKAAKQIQVALSKDVSGCTTKVVDTINGESAVGHSGRLQGEMRAQNFQELGFPSKTAARNANTYGTPSHLQQTHPNVQPVEGRTVPQNACAEHHAFDNYSKSNPGYQAKNTTTATVYHNRGTFTTIKRCDNCKAYCLHMGDVYTDRIPHGTPVPPETYIPVESALHAGCAVALGVALSNKKRSDDSINNNRE